MSTFTHPTWQFTEGLALVFKSDMGSVYDLAHDFAPSLTERDTALAKALLQFALNRLEAQ